MTKFSQRRRTTTTLYAAGLAVVLTLGACGSADQHGQATPQPTQGTPDSTPSSVAPTATPPATPTTTTAAGRRLAVTITGKEVTPAPATIELAVGETLTVTVTSDHHDELHAHGFEVEAELEAGVPTTVNLKGTEPGVFEVETHHPELRLFQVAVR